MSGIVIPPSSWQMLKGSLLSSFAVLPFGTAANIGMFVWTESRVLGFLACLVVIMALQTLIRERITQHIVRRDLRREERISARSAAALRRIEEVQERRRLLDPWHAARMADGTAPGQIGWIDGLSGKAERLSESGRTSGNQTVIEALLDHDRNIPALTAEYVRARESSGVDARARLDRDFLDALEVYEGVMDNALSVIEVEAREGFDARVRHLRGRGGDPLLGPVNERPE